jgi:hypothetical protein
MFYDFGARYLDPRFSKWMTADPALGSYLAGAGKTTVGYQFPAIGEAILTCLDWVERYAIQLGTLWLRPS